MSDVLAPRKPSRTKHRPAASNICWRFCSCLTGSTFRTPRSFKLEHSIYHIKEAPPCEHIFAREIDRSNNLGREVCQCVVWNQVQDPSSFSEAVAAAGRRLSLHCDPRTESSARTSVFYGALTC